MTKSGSSWVRFKGRLTRSLSTAAGDRRAEAKGALEAATGHEPDERAVGAVEHEIRRRHHDIGRRRRRRP